MGGVQPGEGEGVALPGVAVGVVHPLPHGFAAELSHRVPEDQLPPPAPPPGLLGSCSSSALHTTSTVVKSLLSFGWIRAVCRLFLSKSNVKVIKKV